MSGAVVMPAAALSIGLPDFSASAADADSTIAARLVGTADLSVKAALDDFLTNLHQRACDHGVDEVVVDFRSLKFMNSSCLKGLVTWICRVQELPHDAQYRIVLVANADMHWQRRSLHALSCLAADLVSIRN